jgi:multiple sugar transport system permease protein
MNKIKEQKKAVHTLVYILIYLLLIITALSMIFPYLWMVLTSFKDEYEAMSLQLTLLPKTFLAINYKNIWSYIPLITGIKNTIIVEFSVIAIGTFVASLAAFSFAKLKLPFKNIILLTLMSGMMIPYAALLLPQYRAFMALNMTNTLWPLILPGFFGNITMMFFFIQYMKGIPNALFEAAKLDGSGYFTMFIKIMIPLIGPALAAQIIFWFMGIWNDYFAPAIYLTKNEIMTLQPMLAKLNNANAGGTRLPLIMTGAVLSSIPMLIIFISFQKFFIESLAISGVKG